MTWLEELAKNDLEAWKEKGLFRRPRVFSSGQQPEASIDGGRFGLMSSSNYLGLAEHPTVVHAAQEALSRFGAGSGGSRQTTGTTIVHREVENAAARFLGYADAVLFATGYQANLSTIQALAGPNVTIISDARNHASIIDGCRLAKSQGATVTVVPHRNPAEVERALRQCTTPQAIVISDGLFSMDGTLAPLPELLRTCREYGAILMIDDAHAVGTIGPSGRGSAEHWNSTQHGEGAAGMHPDILIATASKALGAEGAFVGASARVAELLRQKARSFVYSTSPSPASCAAILAGLSLLENSSELVQRLQNNVERLRAGLGLSGPWHGPIIPIPVGEEEAAAALSDRLAGRGWYAPAIRWPSVGRSQAILRVTAMATHTEELIDAFAADVRRERDAVPLR